MASERVMSRQEILAMGGIGLDLDNDEIEAMSSMDGLCVDDDALPEPSDR